MAARSKQSKCGSCDKNVAKNSKALLCVGNCKYWFHINCIDITNEEYDLFKVLSGKAVYICVQCKCRLPAVADSACTPIMEEIKSNDAGLTSPEHLRLLTDQIYDLSENYKDISGRLNKIQEENIFLKSAMSNQAEVINDLILNQSNTGVGIKNSYSEIVKVKPVSLYPQLNRTTNLSDNNCDPSQTVSNHNPIQHRHRPSPEFGTVNDSNVGLLDTNSSVSTPGNSHESLVEAKFQTVKTRRQVSREKNDMKSKVRPRPSANSRKTSITGKSTSNHNLTIADRVRYLFVSRFGTGTQCDDIKNYLNEVKKGSYSVDKLTSKHPDKYSSFKVGVPSSLYKDIYLPDIWPNNVYVSQFVNRPSRAEGDLNSISHQTQEGT